MSFMSLTGFAGFPGIRDIQQSVEAAITFGPWEYNRAFILPIVLDGAARDAQSSPTTLLRPGLLLGKNSTTQKFKEWTPGATNGTGKVAGVLLWAMDTQYLNSDDQKWGAWAIFGGNVRANSIICPGEASDIVGLATAVNGRYARKLMAGRFNFDDSYHEGKPSAAFGGFDEVRHISGGVETVTLTAADDNVLFTNKGATATKTFNLPAVALSKGLRFGFQGYAAQSIVITGPAAGTVYANGSANTSLLTSGAVTEGAYIEVIGIDGSVYVARCMFGDLNTATVA